MTLPECRWRGFLPTGRATCASPKLVVGSKGFDPSLCLKCPFVDHAPTIGQCRHLGAEVRRSLCQTCSGRIELKVFACAVHGECTVAKRTDDVKGCCAGCQQKAI